MRSHNLFTLLCPDLQEFMKATVDMADLLGLHLVMSRNAGKGEYKIMVAAMGWATAELVMSRYNTHTRRTRSHSFKTSNIKIIASNS